jgi:hypothetical protein
MGGVRPPPLSKIAINGGGVFQTLHKSCKVWGFEASSRLSRRTLNFARVPRVKFEVRSQRA